MECGIENPARKRKLKPPLPDPGHGQMASAGHRQVWPPLTERDESLGGGQFGHRCTSPEVEHACFSHNNVMAAQSLVKKINFVFFFERQFSLCCL